MSPDPDLMNADRERARGFSVLDWIGTIVTGFGALALLLLPVPGRAFASMFRNMGAADRLPALTRLVISGWLPVILGLLVVCGVVAGVRRALPVPRRRAFIVGAFVLGGVGLAVCLVGLYLPVFAVADAVKAD